MAQRNDQTSIADRQQRFEAPFQGTRNTPLLSGLLMSQRSGTHHGRRRQRYKGGYTDSDGDGNRELLKHAVDHAAHEQQRDEDSDQRNGNRENREADFSGAVQCRSHWRLTHLDVARNIFDHDDGVIHDEADRDGQAHQ
jgi:hypothetical protein